MFRQYSPGFDIETSSNTWVCACIGCDDEDISFVELPARIGIQDPRDPFDLDVFSIVPIGSRFLNPIVDIKSQMNYYCVNKFPLDSDNALLEYTYTFIYGKQESSPGYHPSNNHLAEMISHLRAAPWYGDILVVKSRAGSRGQQLVNVQESELDMIGQILRQLMIGGYIGHVEMAQATLNRLEDDRFAQSFREAGPSISCIYELVWYIAEFCDWDTIAQLSNCNRYLRSLTQQIMAKKLRRFMLPYVPEDSLKRFFSLLSESRAVVTGGLLHAMLLSFADPIYHTVKLFQLEMVVPDNGGRVGFTEAREVKTAEPYAPWSRRTTLLTKQSLPDKLRICLMGSNSEDITPIVLSSPHTSGMNILTSCRIYCLYPSLLRRGENMVVSRSNLVSDLSDTTFQPFNFGLRMYLYGRYFGYGARSCGENCPALWRDIKSMSIEGTSMTATASRSRMDFKVLASFGG
ncbi:hypothetical protein BJ912DRAFT_929189 [Pholiota molesta]|nr:hypothetical protein BJ912DRAFT_929189 [Pholiota molesta]